MYGLLSFKSCFFDDFSARKNNKIGWVTVPKFERREAVEFWGSKAVWAFYYLYLPFKYSPHNDSYAKLFALWTLTEFTTGWLLAFMFQVAHVTPDVEFFKVDEKLASLARTNLGRGTATPPRRISRTGANSGPTSPAD